MAMAEIRRSCRAAGDLRRRRRQTLRCGCGVPDFIFLGNLCVGHCQKVDLYQAHYQCRFCSSHTMKKWLGVQHTAPNNVNVCSSDKRRKDHIALSRPKLRAGLLACPFRRGSPPSPCPPARPRLAVACLCRRGSQARHKKHLPPAAAAAGRRRPWTSTTTTTTTTATRWRRCP